MFQIAYHRDYTPWKQAYSRPCVVAKSFEPVDWKRIERDFVNPEALLLHTCDTGGASSGSPILLDTPDGPEVVGVNVGTYQLSKVLMQDGQVKKRLKADTVANTAVASAAFASRLEAFRDVLQSWRRQSKCASCKISSRSDSSIPVRSTATMVPPSRAQSRRMRSRPD